ncbi:hypothetical protein HMI56_005974 [Coelomomyces lativittatus]|nr:hypothetical protein HMI56_005974 [Coelomomyces lativittatus]
MNAENKMETIKAFITEFQDDGAESDAESFVTANGDLGTCQNTDNAPMEKTSPIVLPDFSLSSFLIAMKAIASNLGINEEFEYSMTVLDNDKEYEIKDPKMHSIQFSPLVQPRKSFFTSFTSYFYTKLQTVIPSKVPSLFTTSILVEMKQRIDYQIHRKIELFYKLPNISHVNVDLVNEIAVMNVSEDCGSMNLVPNPFSLFRRMNPRYIYQLRFLVHTYGLKQAAFILLS